MSNVKLLVITLLPAVTADTTAVAPEDAPVIVSEVVKSVAPKPFVRTYDIGDVVSIILATAPDDEPVICSPLVNVPVIVPIVNSGVVASELVSSESNTPTTLNASARPKDICSSVGLVPNAWVAPTSTFNCLHNCVVLTLDATLVFNIVPINLTFAPEPNIVLSVTVSVAVPVPEVLPDTETISPWAPLPSPAVKIDIV